MVTDAASGVLGLDDDELVACVSCGLCLPHCPTYRVTGLEIASPRGRISAMRAVDAGAVAPDDSQFLRAMNECIQCRGCEAACPSSVQFGHMMEDTRAALHHRVSARRRVTEWLAYGVVLPRRAVLRAVTFMMVVAQRLHLVPKRFGLPRLELSSLREPLRADKTNAPDAWLFTGCVMDAWLRETHRSALRVMHATGASVAVPGRGADCCGALHVHAGRRSEAERLAESVMSTMPGDAPIVVDSAGCGATMADYGRLLGTAEARRFSARVRDFAQWVEEVGPPPLRHTATEILVQDPCHLRHVRRTHESVHTLLARAYRTVTPDDDGLCCGAGGAYALSQPDLSGAVRAAKVEALSRLGGPDAIVASANPGCIMHLRVGGVDARHPADLLAAALEERDA